MKLLAVLGILTGAYLYVLIHTTNIVLAQTQQLQLSYQSADEVANKIATGH